MRKAMEKASEEEILKMQELSRKQEEDRMLELQQRVEKI
jgi:hypothetical protein